MLHCFAGAGRRPLGNAERQRVGKMLLRTQGKGGAARRLLELGCTYHFLIHAMAARQACIYGLYTSQLIRALNSRDPRS